MRIFPITSGLHDADAVAAATREFFATLNLDVACIDYDFDHYGSSDLNLIYVRTGGSEGIFSRLLPQLRQQSSQPFYLLTSGKSNSLPASMEILSYLRAQGIAGEILHGSSEYVRGRIDELSRVWGARRALSGKRVGIVGAPSDWLISSTFDRDAVRDRLGLELINIPMNELLAWIGVPPEPTQVAVDAAVPQGTVAEALPGAERIYLALKALVERYGLSGLTIRCFDLLTAVHNTGCLALARLNSEGIAAGCEGDVPALLSMMVAQAVTGCTGFQSNPARINPETGEILMAHCTIPLAMVDRYELDTHYESGIGVGIRGYRAAGDVTLFKLSGDVKRVFAAEGTLLQCGNEPGLCRTQMSIRLDNADDATYFLTRPIGNHHIVVPGHHAALLRRFAAEQ